MDKQMKGAGKKLARDIDPIESFVTGCKKKQPIYMNVDNFKKYFFNWFNKLSDSMNNNLLDVKSRSDDDLSNMIAPTITFKPQLKESMLDLTPEMLALHKYIFTEIWATSHQDQESLDERVSSQLKFRCALLEYFEDDDNCRKSEELTMDKHMIKPSEGKFPMESFDDMPDLVPISGQRPQAMPAYVNLKNLKQNFIYWSNKPKDTVNKKPKEAPNEKLVKPILAPIFNVTKCLKESNGSFDDMPGLVSIPNQRLLTAALYMNFKDHKTNAIYWYKPNDIKNKKSENIPETDL